MLASTSLALAACAQQPSGPAPIGTDAPVLVPGEPGATARTATPGERLNRPPAEAVAADVRFAEAMIPHHRQALEMTSLVDARTTTTSIRTTAGQIALAQRPEIRLMADWLTRLGRPVPGDHAHGAGRDYGMATAEELNRLRAARGPAFDRLFLELMVRHHEGAVKMAGEELAGGQDQVMRLLARDVSTGQTVEIARMRDLLRSLT
ncbi:DUF305 domain-containing protein [Nonomuraea sp. NN258]|uniref:DUF305 domain-containing protein n=1 Tax=Nonomuraea antri TaxID=2730852 RepID=UPI001567CAF3|nr:DUF305 domain-containing protein [Nonomuraea antri]NRQ39886.1 DUF305 domain-containing protein [Nonomuraea antri]